MNAEADRIANLDRKANNWRKWGPYLSERQWGTVREDYSPDGEAWDDITYDQAMYKSYRWGEDGIGGISDYYQRLCFSLSMWNGKDPHIKERLFGLTGKQGNHGEDVKEYYYYLDNTPSHSYMKYLYKYPISEYPYKDLINANSRRDRNSYEYELSDTGALRDNNYFDVVIEYAKNDPEDILIKVSAHNRSNKEAQINLLPTLWYRNSWLSDKSKRADLNLLEGASDYYEIECTHPTLKRNYFYSTHDCELLFCENETNYQHIYGIDNHSIYTKDGINDYIVNGNRQAINSQSGSKLSLNFSRLVPAGKSISIFLRLSKKQLRNPLDEIEDVFQFRKKEADIFYENLAPSSLSEEEKVIQRQAFAGMLWSKQFYYFDVEIWLKGDEGEVPPPKGRRHGRNCKWKHLNTYDILSMPDKWEYPWFAAWDLAFHLIPFAMIDPQFAKDQLLLITREWYMHPNGQIPAYEWNFSDVNPPVQAWAALRIYRIEEKRFGRKDKLFLERVFQKLLLNFTWWVNRKDEHDNNVFEGGFLGLDNIGIFDRSEQLPDGGNLEQADATSWMAMYCLNMLVISLELAIDNISYEDIATKFFEHFLYIADAMNNFGDEGASLWDEDEKFYFDMIHFPGGEHLHIKIKSIVGLLPLLAVETIEPQLLEKLPEFKMRLEWFVKHRPDLSKNVACMQTHGHGERRLLSIVDKDKLPHVLSKLLDMNEFMSPYGIRSLSKCHKDKPYIFNSDGNEYKVSYEPAESSSPLFGGNSNWRGPVWFPINYLIIESLQKLDYYYGETFKVECPTGSGNYSNLWDVAATISENLISIFKKNEQGYRPFVGGNKLFEDDHFNDCLLFYEYFHGDNGAGIGASHQTGWTGLVAKLVQQRGHYRDMIVKR